MNHSDKKQGFDRLLSDLQTDSFHGEFVEEREHLPKIAKAAEIENLRGRLRRRYQQTRLSATTMYMPRIALTFAVMLTCAVAFVYINKLKQLENEEKRKKEQLQQIDSLIKNRK